MLMFGLSALAALICGILFITLAHIFVQVKILRFRQKGVSTLLAAGIIGAGFVLGLYTGEVLYLDGSQPIIPDIPLGFSGMVLASIVICHFFFYRFGISYREDFQPLMQTLRQRLHK